MDLSGTAGQSEKDRRTNSRLRRGKYRHTSKRRVYDRGYQGDARYYDTGGKPPSLAAGSPAAIDVNEYRQLSSRTGGLSAAAIVAKRFTNNMHRNTFTPCEGSNSVPYVMYSYVLYPSSIEGSLPWVEQVLDMGSGASVITDCPVHMLIYSVVVLSQTRRSKGNLYRWAQKGRIC